MEDQRTLRPNHRVEKPFRNLSMSIWTFKALDQSKFEVSSIKIILDKS